MSVSSIESHLIAMKNLLNVIVEKIHVHNLIQSLT